MELEERMPREWTDSGDEDDFPQDTAEYDPSDLEFRTETVARLLEYVDDYLTFGTIESLIQLIKES